MRLPSSSTKGIAPAQTASLHCCSATPTVSPSSSPVRRTGAHQLNLNPRSVLGTKGGIALLHRAVEHHIAATPPNTAEAASTLCTLCSVLPSPDNRKLFVRGDGVPLLLRAWDCSEDGRLRSAVCAATAAAATACEPAKEQVMECGLAQALVQVTGCTCHVCVLVRRMHVTVSNHVMAPQWLGACANEDALSNACAALVALTTADDATAPASRCAVVPCSIHALCSRCHDCRIHT